MDRKFRQEVKKETADLNDSIDQMELTNIYCMYVCILYESHSVASDALQPHGLYIPWNFPGQNSEVGSLSLLHGIFPTQGLNPGAPHCREVLYQLSHKGSPRILEWVVYPFSSGSSWLRNQNGVSCTAGNFLKNLISIIIIIFYTLQYCIGFAIHKHASITDVHVFQSWTPLPSPSPYHPSGSSQCTSPKLPISAGNTLPTITSQMDLPNRILYPKQ